MNNLKFKLSPELSDGLTYCVVKTPDEVLHIIGEWMKHKDEYGYAGDSFNVTLVDMTDEEVDNLPEI